MSAGVTYTFSQLKSASTHASGKSQLSAGTDHGQVVNRALEFMVNWHSWNWRRTTLALTVTQNVGQVDLPQDFGEMEYLVGQGAWATQRIRPGNMRDVLLCRVHSTLLNAAVNGANLTLYHVSAKAPGGLTSVPLRQLELAPLPTPTTGSLLSMSYFKLLPTLVNDTDVPAIPAGMFDPLLQLVRCFSLSTEEIAAGETAPSWELATRQLEVARATDGYVMPRDFPDLHNVVEDYYDAGAKIRPFG